MRTFLWMITVLAGMTVRTDLLGITSIVRALGLQPICYDRILDFFHSWALDLNKLTRLWRNLVFKTHPGILRVKGRPMLVGDGIEPFIVKTQDFKGKTDAIYAWGGGRYLYFNIDEAFAFDLYEKDVTVFVTYRDAGCSSSRIEYNSSNPKNMLKLTRKELRPIRDKLLAPFGMKFDAPNKVALYLIGDRHVVVESFNDEPIDAVLEFPKPVKARKTLVLPMNGNVELSGAGGKLRFTKITPRTLVVIEY